LPQPRNVLGMSAYAYQEGRFVSSGHLIERHSNAVTASGRNERARWRRPSARRAKIDIRLSGYPPFPLFPYLSIFLCKILVQIDVDMLLSA
jgi:hypothetical protein